MAISGSLLVLIVVIVLLVLAVVLALAPAVFIFLTTLCGLLLWVCRRMIGFRVLRLKILRHAVGLPEAASYLFYAGLEDR